MVSKSSLISTIQYFFNVFLCVYRQNQVLHCAVFLCTPCSFNSLYAHLMNLINSQSKKCWVSTPPSDNWQKGGGLRVSKFLQVLWKWRAVPEASVMKWKAVNSVQTILDAIKFWETTPNRNTPTLVQALDSGNHQRQTQNYRYNLWGNPVPLRWNLYVDYLIHTD